VTDVNGFEGILIAQHGIERGGIEGEEIKPSRFPTFQGSAHRALINMRSLRDLVDGWRSLLLGLELGSGSYNPLSRFRTARSMRRCCFRAPEHACALGLFDEAFKQRGAARDHVLCRR
jgi:hypothetical protein